MKQIAIKASVITFFAMAIIGSLCDQSTDSIAIRSAIGAVIAYIAASLALRLAVNVMVQAVVEKGETLDGQEDAQAGRTDESDE